MRLGCLFTFACVLSFGSATAQTTLTVNLIDSSTIAVKDTATGNASETVNLYLAASSSACTNSVAKIELTPAVPTGPAADTLSSGTGILHLSVPLTPGKLFCAIAAGGATTPTSVIYIYVPVRTPVFTKSPTDGSSLLQIQATAPDSADTPAWTTTAQILSLLSTNDVCDLAHGATLTLAGGTTVTNQTVDKSGTAAFSLGSALAAGSVVCAVQTITLADKQLTMVPESGLYTSLASTPRIVSSATDWGLVRSYFTGGIVLANDSSNFSSAYQFFELNVDKTWKVPDCNACDPSPAPSAVVSPSTTTIPVPANAYTITGSNLSVTGATLSSAGTLTPSGPSITVSGRHLIIMATTGPPTTIPVNGAITVTTSPLTYTGSSKLKIQGGAIVFQGKQTLTILTASNLTFGGAAQTDTSTRSYRVGFSSFFDARLTSIPISANPTNTTTPTTSTPTSSSFSILDTTTPATTPVTTSFLNTQKTARLAVGVYAPFLISHWLWNGASNALFVAPIAKIGFDTLTGATQQTVILPGGTTGTQTYDQVYNYRTYGGRVGHMQLSGAKNQAPEVYSYLDIGFGPFSNLESLICGRTLYTGTATGPVAPIAGQRTATSYTNSACTAEFPSLYQSAPAGDVYQVYESRKRVYRLDLEGLLKIPGTIFYVGFNANLGQKAVLAQHEDLAFKAPDDLRFFFGTKFDISTLLSKLGVNLGN